MVRSVPIIRRKWIGCPKHHWNHLPQSPPMISCPTSIYHRSVHIYTIDIRTRSKKKKKLQKSYLYLNWNIYIYMMESPLAMQVRYCLVNKKPVYPSPPSHTFFSGASSKRRNASRRLPSFAACCSAACCSCFCPQHMARALPGPTPAGLVCWFGGVMDVYGGYICSCLTDLLKKVVLFAPRHAQTKWRDSVGGRPAYLMSCTTWTCDVFSNKDPKVHQLNRGVEP